MPHKDPEARRAYNKQYRSRPDYKQKKKEAERKRMADPKKKEVERERVKRYLAEYYKRPEVVEHRKHYIAKYRARPGVLLRLAEHTRRYRARLTSQELEELKKTQRAYAKIRYATDLAHRERRLLYAKKRYTDPVQRQRMQDYAKSPTNRLRKRNLRYINQQEKLFLSLLTLGDTK